MNLNFIFKYMKNNKNNQTQIKIIAKKKIELHHNNKIKTIIYKVKMNKMIIKV